MTAFEQAHSEWISTHLRQRKGERKRRLQEGHRHAEKEMLQRIWWPAFGHIHHLHPEYEVIDYRGISRFIDLAYVRHPVHIAIEVDGYGPHVLHASRRQYCNQWVRHMHLTIGHWIVVRIGYDDVMERPELWQQLFQQLFGRLFGNPAESIDEADCVERDVIRYAMGLGRPIKQRDVADLLRCGTRHARTMLRRLEEKHWLIPEGGGPARTHSWRLNLDNKHIPLFEY